MKKATLLHLFFGCTLMASAQLSTICHKDGTVTFQYKNNQAKEVQVDVQFAGRTPMTRGADRTSRLWWGTGHYRRVW